MAELEIKNLYKTFDQNVQAVSNFNIDIHDGEFIVLVGPSGCGKSTTLRMIAGLENITEGSIYIDEVKVNDVAPKDRDIAMVFQNYALYPHMDVYSNMAFGLKLRKFDNKTIKERVDYAATILGITELLDRKPGALSGGQRQRVALGRAIVRDPKVFLMDEPLSNLDAKLRVQMRTEIQKLHKRLKATTIYVTHDQTEAMTMADRLVVMKDGVIQQIDSPKDIYDYPKNVFVGGFIGSPSMNFFEGVIDDNFFEIKDIRIKIPEDKYNVLDKQGYNGKDIILGIRPEDLHVDTKSKETNKTEIEAIVEISELMGADIIIYSHLYEQEFVSRVNSRANIKNGDKIKLDFNMDNCHFFDFQTKFRIN